MQNFGRLIRCMIGDDVQVAYNTGIHFTSVWRETKWSKVPCLRKQRNGPPDPEFEALTGRQHTPPQKPRLPLILVEDANLSQQYFLDEESEISLLNFSSALGVIEGKKDSLKKVCVTSFSVFLSKFKLAGSLSYRGSTVFDTITTKIKHCTPYRRMAVRTSRLDHCPRRDLCVAWITT